MLLFGVVSVVAAWVPSLALLFGVVSWGVVCLGHCDFVCWVPRAWSICSIAMRGSVRLVGNLELVCLFTRMGVYGRAEVGGGQLGAFGGTCSFDVFSLCVDFV